MVSRRPAGGREPGRIAVSVEPGEAPGAGRLGPGVVIAVRDLALPKHRVVYRLRLTLRDVTGAEPDGGGGDPVLAVRPEDRGSGPEASNFEKWVTVEPSVREQSWTVSADDLVFPRRGQRTLEAVVELFLDRDAAAAARGSSRGPAVEVLDPGYLEGPPRRWSAHRAAVRLAVGMARADGGADAPGRERWVIEEWVERRLAGEPEASRARLRAFLLEPLAELEEGAGPDHSLRFREILGELKHLADLPFLYEVADLCFDVMRADARVHEAEWELITRIEEVAGLDPERCRALQEMRLSPGQRETAGRWRVDRGSSLPPGSLPV
jgi:hypothetical protein